LKNDNNSIARNKSDETKGVDKRSSRFKDNPKINPPGLEGIESSQITQNNPSMINAKSMTTYDEFLFFSRAPLFFGICIKDLPYQEV